MEKENIENWLNTELNCLTALLQDSSVHNDTNINQLHNFKKVKKHLAQNAVLIK